MNKVLFSAGIQIGGLEISVNLKKFSFADFR